MKHFMTIRCMSIYILIIAISLLLTGCIRNSNRQNNSNSNSKQSNLIIHEEIKKYLEDHIINSLKHGNSAKDDTYVVVFANKDVFLDTPTTDSIIYISTLNCDDLNYYDTYRGVLNVSNYVIALFDNTTFGKSFYDEKQIVGKPFNSLKCQQNQMRLTLLLKIHNNRIIQIM